MRCSLFFCLLFSCFEQIGPQPFICFPFLEEVNLDSEHLSEATPEKVKASLVVAEAYTPKLNQKVPDIRFEAYVIEDQRILDGDDDYIRFDKGLAEDERSLDNLDRMEAARSYEEDQRQGGWRFQNPARVRQKIKRTIQRELRNPDLMSEEDALVVGANLQRFVLFNTFRFIMLHDYVILPSFFRLPSLPFQIQLERLDLFPNSCPKIEQLKVKEYHRKV